MSQIARPREGNQLGGTASTAPQVLPIITAAPGVRSKIAAIVARDFSVTPLKVLIAGDSNSRSGYYANGNTTARISTYERLCQYLGSPMTGFTSLENPMSGGCYVPFGPTAQTNLYDEFGNVRCQNSSNWIKASPPASGQWTGGSTSFVKDPASAGYGAMRLDRRQSTYAQFAGKHDFEMTATRMKVFFSVGQAASVQIDRNFGNTSMSTGATDATVAGNGFHGTLTIRFWDMVGAASISSTTVTATTSNSLGFNHWGGFTTDWITLPNSGTYPYIEIRCETAIGVRVAVDGVWFDDGAPKVQVFDASYPGRAINNISPITYNQSGVSTDTAFTARRNYFMGLRHLTKAVYQFPVTFDGTSYPLAGAPTHFPVFPTGVDAVLHPCIANDMASNTPAKIKAELLAMMAEFVVDNPDGIFIHPIILRGMGPLASLDSYIAGTATVGGVPNQSCAMYRQAIYDVQVAYPNNFVVMDLNAAINNKFFAGVQPTATVLNNTLGFYSISDGLHTDPWVEDTIALATSLFLSGKL
jgi:hypothetical protein